MTFLARRNGTRYFLPIVLVATTRLPAFEHSQQGCKLAIVYFNDPLAVSTLASIVDRAIAPMLHKEK